MNMSQLGHALTELKDPPVKALFVYNSNPAAIAPNQNAVLRGMMRDDLFTVVHEQFLSDTTDYADIVLPATTFLEHKDFQGAYGHYFLQMSEQAIAPLGEARSNIWLFRQLAERMGFTEPCFQDSVDDMIEQALNTPSIGGITREELERENRIRVAPPIVCGWNFFHAQREDRVLFKRAGGRRHRPYAYVSPAGRVAARRRSAHLSARISAAQGRQLHELHLCQPRRHQKMERRGWS